MRQYCVSRLNWGLVPLLGALAMGGGYCGTVCADEILSGEVTIHRAQLVGFASGLVEYRTAEGDHDKLPVWAIDYLVIDSVSNVADFNEAEEYLVKNQPAQAVGRYERALRGLTGYWADLAQARLLMASDRAEVFEKAVRAFLTLLEKDPVAAAHLLPESLPAAASPAAARTTKKLEGVVAESTSDSNRLLVEFLLYEALRKQGDAAATALAATVVTKQLPAALMTARTAKVKASAMEALMRAGRSEEIIAAIDASLVDLPTALMPEFLLLKARALLSGAETSEAWMDAALPAMRVAIHFADTPAAGEGLLLAAEAHERAGLTEDATRLLRHCLTLESASEEAKNKARQALVRLAAAGDHEQG